jgi:hypothetical protein
MLMIKFIFCFLMVKVEGCGTFPKCRTELSYCLVLGPDFVALPYIMDPFMLEFSMPKQRHSSMPEFLGPRTK